MSINALFNVKCKIENVKLEENGRNQELKLENKKNQGRDALCTYPELPALDLTDHRSPITDHGI